MKQLSLRHILRRFRQDKDGSSTVEFVLIFPVIFFFIIFVFLLAMDYFWLLTSQKAVERGARMAITRLPVADALIEDGRVIAYERVAGVVPAGTSCNPGPLCQSVPTYSCRGGKHISEDAAAACDATRFNAIYTEVLRLAPNSITPEDVTITYSDSMLGRATESYIPVVTVELSQTRVLSAFRWIDSLFSVGEEVERTVSASLVGEQLGN